MSAILECKNISKSFAGKKALDQVSLTVEPGKIVGLLGPNGSGKTTLLKLINGLLTASEGEILVDGKRPGTESKAVISYLPDKNYLNDWMRVKDLVTYFKDFYKDFKEDRAILMLSKLDINIEERLKTLSKGMKEKVQLILVMSREAKLYLLDEPIGGVDPASRAYIIDTIIRNYNPEATVIISTHLISDIEKVLDEVIFISKGQIILSSSVDALREERGMSVDSIFREVFRC